MEIESGILYYMTVPIRVIRESITVAFYKAWGAFKSKEIEIELAGIRQQV